MLGSPHGSGLGESGPPGAAAPESTRLWPPLWVRTHAGGAPNLAPELLAGGAALPHALTGADAATEGAPAALQLDQEEDEEGREVRCVRRSHGHRLSTLDYC